MKIYQKSSIILKKAVTAYILTDINGVIGRLINKMRFNHSEILTARYPML